MRRVTVILSLATAAFAASTVYLASEMYLRDADALTVAAPAPLATVTNTPQSPEPGGTPATAAANNPTPAGTPPGRGSERADDAVAGIEGTGKPDEATQHFLRQLVARFDDPVQRTALLQEARTGVRRQYDRLKKDLKLSDATFEQLVTLLAEENLQMQEHFARCAIDPRCNPNDPSRRAPLDSRNEEILALLGAQGAEALTTFRGSIGERDTVIQLRGRLADSHFLPESQAEQLISALADEREQFKQEAEQSGASVRGWGTQLGMLWYTDDSGSVDQYVAEATQYSQRLRARAAAVLTPAQLAAFVQLQEELLAQLAAYVKPPARKANMASVRPS